jgi:hypothetical protein
MKIMNMMKMFDDKDPQQEAQHINAGWDKELIVWRCFCKTV